MQHVNAPAYIWANMLHKTHNVHVILRPIFKYWCMLEFLFAEQKAKSLLQCPKSLQ